MESSGAKVTQKLPGEDEIFHYQHYSYRIRAENYLALRAFYKLNGIPRYVLVDAQGKIRNDKFQNHSFASEMITYFPQKFTQNWVFKRNCV